MVLSAGVLAVAGVPTSLFVSPVKAGKLFAAGQAPVEEVISGKVATLTEGVLKAMLWSKLETANFLVLVIGVLGWGGGVLVWQTRAGAQQPLPLAGTAPATKQAEEPLQKTLLALDEQLWNAAKKGDGKVYDRLLANDYIGYSARYGRSDKEATIRSLEARRYADWTIRGVETMRICKDVALITYVYSCKVTSVSGNTIQTYRHHRSSFVWTNRDGAWVLVFCQDTILPGGA